MKLDNRVPHVSHEFMTLPGIDKMIQVIIKPKPITSLLIFGLDDASIHAHICDFALEIVFKDT